MFKKLPNISYQVFKFLVFFLLVTGYWSLVTGHFPVFASETPSFIKVEDLGVSDTVFINQDGESLKQETIVEKKWVEEPVEVYNLTVGGNETYFANDLAVHNKTPWVAKAYFYWDKDRDGCHDHPNGTQPCETDGLIGGKAEPIVTSQGMANWSDNRNIGNPNWTAAQVGEAYFHYTASWYDDYTGKDKNHVDLFNLNNENCVNDGGIVTKYDEPTAGACTDGWIGEGSSGVFPFGQTRRGEAFRIGGVNFKDDDTSANRPIYRYQTYCAECSDPWCPYCYSWGPPWKPGYPPSVYSLDVKPEKDFTDANDDGVADDESIGSWPNRVLMTQAAEFTADYTGWYLFGQFPSRGGPGGARIYEISTRPAGGVSLDNLSPRLCGRSNLPYKINECEASLGPGVYPLWPDRGKPEAFGYTGNFVCESAHYKLLYKGGSSCWLDKTKEYLMLIDANGGDPDVFTGRYWSWPFLMWFNARLAGVVPDGPEPVAAIPLIEAGPIPSTIQARVWNETSTPSRNCILNAGETGVDGISIAVSPNATPVIATTTSSSTTYDFIVSPPGTHTVSITIPAGSSYVISPNFATCGITQVGATHYSRTITIANGETKYADFPLVRTGSIYGHVYKHLDASATCATLETTNPVEGITVRSTDGSLSDTTNSEGYFNLGTEIPARPYVLEIDPATLAGYSPSDILYCPAPPGRSLTISADSGGDYEVDIGLLSSLSWFQVKDGDTHAEGIISSSIPATATEPFFDLDGDGGTPGVVSYGGSSADFGEGSVSAPPAEWLAQTAQTRKLYSYFYRLLGSPTDETFDGTLPSGDGVYYAGSGQTLSGDWTLPVDRKIVVLVDGDLEVGVNIDVPVGSSLVMVVSGGINFTEATIQVEGIFLANGTIDTGSASEAFVGEGSFVAGGFSLNRDFGDGRNNTTPVEQFLFRPDILLNSLTEIWPSAHTWEELAP